MFLYNTNTAWSKNVKHTASAIVLGTLVHPFNGLFSRTTWVSWYQKGKNSPDLNEARNDEVLECTGISSTICKQSAESL